MEHARQVARRVAWLAACTLVYVGATAGDANAGRVERAQIKHLRQEIETLRAELTEMKSHTAQLRTAVEFQGRSSADATRPVASGGICADPCADDSDGDGVNDCEDQCPCDPNNADSDGDQMLDCWDPCPDDATNACIDPCRNDSDGDGLNDCEDPCPFDPSESKDTDSDGIPDCQDPCPDDATNRCFDPCPLDQDGDGMKDCSDICPWILGPGDPNSPLRCPFPGEPATGVMRRSK